MTYDQQVRAAWVVFALGLLGAGVLLFKDPADLGLSPVAYHWIAVLNFVLIGLGAALPSVRSLGTDPAHLADRVWALPPVQRREVDDDLLARAAAERMVPRG